MLAMLLYKQKLERGESHGSGRKPVEEAEPKGLRRYGKGTGKIVSLLNEADGRKKNPLLIVLLSWGPHFY